MLSLIDNCWKQLKKMWAFNDEYISAFSVNTAVWPITFDHQWYPKNKQSK